MPDVRSLFEPGGGLDALLAKISTAPPLQGQGPVQIQAQTQMQAQWQAMRLSAERLTPESIRMAVLSALGSETSLGRVRNPAPLDPKQLLHQLLKAVTDTSNDAEGDAEVQQIKRALGDLDAAQIGAVKAQGEGAMAMSVVLPFVNQAPVELRFERQATAPGQESVYTVSAHSNSEDYGELWLKADLHGDTELDLSMWALRDGVVAMAQSGAQALRDKLREAGLSMRSFHAHAGARPMAPAAVQPQALPGTVLDFRV
jgi:hypothetical protein